MTKSVILDWSCNDCGSVEWPEWLSSSIVRYDIMHRVLVWQQARAHKGSRSVKTRSEVVARKQKPFRQKGTGRARQGSTVAPHMRGGGVCFGPAPTEDRTFALPKRVRRMGLRSALALRLQEKALFVFKEGDFASEKTKDFVACVTKNGWTSGLFVSADKGVVNLLRVCANVKGFNVLPVAGLNVDGVLRHKNIFIAQDAFDAAMHKVRM